MTTVQTDSTRSDGLLGLAYCLALTAVMVSGFFSHEPEFWQVLNVAAAVIFLGNVVRIVFLLPRLRP